MNMVIPLVTGFHTHTKSHLAHCFTNAKEISNIASRHAGEKILISQSSSKAYCIDQREAAMLTSHVGVQSVIH